MSEVRRFTAKGRSRVGLIGSEDDLAVGDAGPQSGNPRVVSLIVSLLRLVIAIAVAGLLFGVLWLRRPTQLSPHLDIVGYPTFYNFVFTPNFLLYRLVVWELPLVTAIVYALLCWRGPLRRRPRADDSPVRQVVLEDEQREVGRSLVARLLIVVPPAALLTVAISARRPVYGGTVNGPGIVAGILYAVIVLAAGLAIARSPLRLPARHQPLELVNAVGCVLVGIGAVGFVAHHAWIEAADGRRQYWRFIPLWAVLLALVLGFAWTAWRLRGGWTSAKIERRLRRLLVGGAFVFVATSAMPGAVGHIAGFDDSQSFTGAGLLSRGYFPWRDFLFIHGLFEDALRSSVGFVLLQHTIWATIAGSTLVVVPMTWVGLYLLGAWSSRRGGFIGLFVLAFAVWNGVPAALFFRFVALPFVFILLGEALRHSDLRWTMGLAAGVFLDGLLVPESSFQAIAVVLALVGSDLVHRDLEKPWYQGLRRSAVFVLSGAVLAAVWAVFLAANHALGAFVQYYLIFGPGHNAAGAVPKSVPHGLYNRMFYLTITLVVLTLAVSAWRVIGRRSWTARDWVMLAAAITAGLYQEKALGRFDAGHLLQTIGVALSLWTLWAATLLDWADGVVPTLARRVTELRPVLPMVTRVASILALVIVYEQVPVVPHLLWHVPQNDKQKVPSLAQVPLVGYSQPGAEDPALMADFTTVLNTYAGPKGTIFDNTNSLGYFYYLLGRAPASAFVHVSMAVPEYAQKVLIGQLRKSRPPVVVFDVDDTIMGLPSWDGPRNNVRHFEVAQYLLDGWTPVLRSHSALFLMRNDLVASKPPTPALMVPPVTSDLYFTNPSCDWGDTPNFLDSPSAGQSLALTVHPQGKVRIITVAGWAYDVDKNQPVTKVVVAAGGVVIGQVDVNQGRGDVAASTKEPNAINSGFSGTVSTTRIGGIRVYAVLGDGSAVPVNGTGVVSAKRLTVPGGAPIPVVNLPKFGALDHNGLVQYQLSTAEVPAGTTLASYQLVTFGADKPIGDGSILLSDSLTIPGTSSFGQHLITANTMADRGKTLAVRVGSCLQWHGYHTSTLYVLQNGGAPITSLRLSDTK